MSQITLKKLYNLIPCLALRRPHMVWGFILCQKIQHSYFIQVTF